MSIASPSQARTAWVMRRYGSSVAAEASSITRNGSELRISAFFSERRLLQMAEICAIGDWTHTTYALVVVLGRLIGFTLQGE